MKFTSMDLKSLTILQGLSEEVFNWLIKCGTKVELVKQDHLFSKGQVATFMFIVVRGTIQRYEEIAGQLQLAAITRSGQVTGMLPYSRMTHYPGDAVAVEDSLVLSINKKNFNEMLTISHELGQRLVAEMSNRIRGDVRLEQQREKMVSLGRLSAGLAHELNNPAAAILQTSEILTTVHADIQQLLMSISKNELSKSIIEKMENELLSVINKEIPKYTPLQLDQRSEDFTVWLEKRKIKNAWNISNIFAKTDLQINNLENIAESIPSNILNDLLFWISCNIQMNQMMTEIKSAAKNITELVSSIKIYSHMDQSLESNDIDIREGLDNTLKMFAHKIREKNIRIKKQYPDILPLIHGNVGDLNQVWTNLIENAIFAIPKDGELDIEINSTDKNMEVRIIDNGSGIPENIIHRIFDPLFTTKEVGEGTGMGLDIAQRIVSQHGGHIQVFSKPGRTEFYVMLPINL